MNELTRNHQIPEIQRVDFNFPVEIVHSTMSEDWKDCIEAIFWNLTIIVNGSNARYSFSSNNTLALIAKNFNGIFLK